MLIPVGDPLFLGSLTLGGYDSSRYIPNNASFVFAPDNERELVVGLAGLTASTSTQTKINLLPIGGSKPTLPIDTTVAELWLPLEICQAFEDAFSLTYDNVTELYLVDEILHETLKAQNATVTFTLDQSYSTNETVEIALPYAAFDLQAEVPYRGLRERSRYFPLRRADNSTQWALGRMFLQEAYLTVDWERARFSVHQCDWTYNKPSEIIPIVSPSYMDKSSAEQSTNRPTNGVVIGVVVGCVFVVILIATVVVGYFWRRRCNRLAAMHAANASEAEAARKASPTDTDDDPSSPTSERGPNVFPKAELPGTSSVLRPEMCASGKGKVSVELAEVEDTGRLVYEMLGDIPAPQEAAGRQLSEKETMMVREKIINGVDPSAGVSVTSPSARPAPITSLDDIATVATSLPGSGVSPITPRAPRDGAYLEAGDAPFSPLPPYRAQHDGRSVDDLYSPISPLEARPTTDDSRRRFSYES